ncbi:hypothetical protein [Variovorax saccharolyticus]|uniref:hypothetical protein n=1 Tax=Variovorax saccharolyticus TaxID=3053516 RepID=UPI002574FA0E|nr:hypothetical protein [Variovorax sp. J31P216]MDM0030180.1 hypothetical protein [Variovorax sp. J31P216]
MSVEAIGSARPKMVEVAELFFDIATLKIKNAAMSKEQRRRQAENEQAAFAQQADLMESRAKLELASGLVKGTTQIAAGACQLNAARSIASQNMGGSAASAQQSQMAGKESIATPAPAAQPVILKPPVQATPGSETPKVDTVTTPDAVSAPEAASAPDAAPVLPPVQAGDYAGAPGFAQSRWTGGAHIGEGLGNMAGAAFDSQTTVKRAEETRAEALRQRAQNNLQAARENYDADMESFKQTRDITAAMLEKQDRALSAAIKA